MLQEFHTIRKESKYIECVAFCVCGILAVDVFIECWTGTPQISFLWSKAYSKDKVGLSGGGEGIRERLIGGEIRCILFPDTKSFSLIR